MKKVRTILLVYMLPAYNFFLLHPFLSLSLFFSLLFPSPSSFPSPPSPPSLSSSLLSLFCLPPVHGRAHPVRHRASTQCPSTPTNDVGRLQKPEPSPTPETDSHGLSLPHLLQWEDVWLSLGKSVALQLRPLKIQIRFPWNERGGTPIISPYDNSKQSPYNDNTCIHVILTMYIYMYTCIIYPYKHVLKLSDPIHNRYPYNFKPLHTLHSTTMRQSSKLTAPCGKMEVCTRHQLSCILR